MVIRIVIKIVHFYFLFDKIKLIISSNQQNTKLYPQIYIQNPLNLTTTVHCNHQKHYSKNGILVEWPEILNEQNTSMFYLSDPPCYVDDDEYYIRKCIPNIGWEYPIDLRKCHIPKIGQYCPKDFQTFIMDEDHYCVKVSTIKEEWNEQFCYGSNKKLFDLNRGERKAIFSYYMNKLNVTEFWLPAKRINDDFMYSPVVWKLPAQKWGQIFDEKILYNEISENQCIIAIITSEYKIKSVNITNCLDKHYNLCVFKKTSDYNSWCPPFWYSLINNPSICYGIEKTTTDFNRFKVELNKFFQPHRIITDKIELKNEKQSIFLYDKHDNMRIVQEIRNGEINILKLKPNKLVTMLLQFNEQHETLILTVYNRMDILHEYGSYGITCFTNADYELVRHVKMKNLFWENDNQSKSLFELKIYGTGPGQYWCEAHQTFDYKLIKTDKILAAKREKGQSFAFFYNLSCNLIDCSKINKNIKKYAKIIEKELKNLKENSLHEGRFDILEIHNVKIMNIVLIERDVNIRFLCHILASLKGSSNRDDDDDEDDDSSEESEEDIKIEQNKNGTQFTHMKIKLRDLISELVSNSPNQNKSHINSTEFCLPEINSNKWRIAKLGWAATTKNLCLMPNGLPLTRKCIGDFIYGAIWENFTTNIQCIQSFSQDIITDKLFEIERLKAGKTSPLKVLKSIKEMIVERNFLNIIPADFYYLGRILQSISKRIIDDQNRKSKNLTDYENYDNITQIISKIQYITSPVFEVFNTTNDLVSIYNYLMDINMNIIQPSIKLNSTNILLESFENLINEISTARIEINKKTDEFKNNFTINDDDILDDGIFVQINPNIMIFTIDLTKTNFSGVAIYSTNESENIENFLECDYKFINKYQSRYDILEEDNLQIATFVPISLLERLDEIEILSDNGTVNLAEKPSPKIVIKLYRNDHLFVENRNVTNVKVLGMVISISIPNYDKDLPELLPIYLKKNTINNGSDMNNCRYWNYKTWAEDGLEFLAISKTNKNLILYGCSHLTPFAYLVGGSYNLSVSSDIVIITQIHHEALDLITLLGCTLSLLGIIGIFTTAIIFQSWREKPSTKVLLQLSGAIGLQMILFCFVNTELLTMHLIVNEIFSSCIALGALLHYFVLVEFSWMFIIAYLQYKRYVQVLGNTRPTRFFIKTFLLGWGAPSIPVILVILIDRDAYIPEEFDTSKICYPSGLALYYGVMLPIAIIIFANLVIFFIIFYNLIRGPDGSLRHTEKKLAISQLRLLILLFFLLGLTWIFGFLSTMKAGLIFSYLFCLTATFQGFVLFIYFVILDPVTRKLWSNFLRSILNKNKEMK